MPGHCFRVDVVHNGAEVGVLDFHVADGAFRRKIPSEVIVRALAAVEHGQDHFHVLLGRVRSDEICENDIPNQLAAGPVRRSSSPGGKTPPR